MCFAAVCMGCAHSSFLLLLFNARLSLFSLHLFSRIFYGFRELQFLVSFNIYAVRICCCIYIYVCICHIYDVYFDFCEYLLSFLVLILLL